MLHTRAPRQPDRNWQAAKLCTFAITLCLATMLAASGSTIAGAAKLIVLDMAGDEFGDAASPANVARNMAHIENVGFDGVVVRTQAGWDLMLPGKVLNYADIMETELAPLRKRMGKVNANFLVTYVMNVDPFDSWSQVIGNWVTLARAARDVGMVGLVFDNEAYNGNVWTYPEDVTYADAHTLSAYQEQYRERGRQLMRALAVAWPSIRFMALHGPYVSDPRTPAAVVLEQAAVTDRDLSGFFFAGILEAAPPTASVMDGGEIYQYRTRQEFEDSYAFRRFILPRLQPSDLVPPALRDVWSEKIDISFGVYDEQWKDGYKMDPTILQATLTNALRQADNYVWLYTEQHDYLTSGSLGPTWLSAVQQAVAAARR